MITGMITVADPVAGQLPPFTEGFESLVFPPNGITVENPDGEHTWELDTVAVQAEGIASARIDNLTYTNYGQSDALVLPSFDLLNFGATPSLRFRWAYARSSPNYSTNWWCSHPRIVASTSADMDAQRWRAGHRTHADHTLHSR